MLQRPKVQANDDNDDVANGFIYTKSNAHALRNSHRMPLCTIDLRCTHDDNTIICRWRNLKDF